MQLVKAPRDALLKPLQVVSGIVERRQTLPILANVLLRRDGERLSFTATDLEIQIQTGADLCSGKESAATTVSARKLLDILRALPDDEVTLALANKRLAVQCGRSRFSLQTLAAEEFPTVSQAEFNVDFTLSSIAFKHLLAMVHFAMAAQEVIIPRKTVLELARLLPDSDEPVRVQMASGQVRLSFGAVEFISKLVEGKFPDYGKVVPVANPKQFLIGRETLMQALSRVAILTTDKFKGVRCVLGPGSLKISSTNTDQEEAQEEIEIEYPGEALDIGFNVTYLLDVLSNLKSEQLKFAFGDALGSALVTLPDSDRFKYVVMPMRI